MIYRADQQYNICTLCSNLSQTNPGEVYHLPNVGFQLELDFSWSLYLISTKRLSTLFAHRSTINKIKQMEITSHLVCMIASELHG